MSQEKSGPGQGREQGKYPLLLTLLSGLSFVLLLLLIIFLGNKVDTLEDHLGYKAPVAAGSGAYGGAYGIEIVSGQTVYVPVYSHIYADGGKPQLLETTLSIRNLDPEVSISLKAVDYFDTGGQLVKRYLGQALSLAPLETTEILVEKSDTRGGSGANFIIVWDSNEPVYEPLIEAVMVSVDGAKSFSFTSSGRALVERKE
jgi:hypothetical protein